MKPALRIFLVIAAGIVLIFVVKKLHKAQFGTSDSLFWLLMSLCLVLFAIFPQIAFFFSSLLGIQSPSNFVFLTVIGLLLLREFHIQAELSQLRKRVTNLAQKIAIDESKNN